MLVAHTSVHQTHSLEQGLAQRNQAQYALYVQQVVTEVRDAGHRTNCPLRIQFQSRR